MRRLKKRLEKNSSSMLMWFACEIFSTACSAFGRRKREKANRLSSVESAARFKKGEGGSCISQNRKGTKEARRNRKTPYLTTKMPTSLGE